MTEAEKYTTAMWQSFLGSVVAIVNASDAKRDAFITGFNGGREAGIHHTARATWARGRHAAVLLGYLDAPNG